MAGCSPSIRYPEQYIYLIVLLDEYSDYSEYYCSLFFSKNIIQLFLFYCNTQESFPYRGKRRHQQWTIDHADTLDRLLSPLPKNIEARLSCSLPPSKYIWLLNLLIPIMLIHNKQKCTLSQKHSNVCMPASNFNLNAIYFVHVLQWDHCTEIEKLPVPD